MNKKDREIILSMMEYLFPKIKISEGYNAGSDSSIAPFTDALMKTVLNLASNLNDVFELFKDFIISFSWGQSLERHLALLIVDIERGLQYCWQIIMCR